MDRITAIKESLATYVCGVLSFFPLVGVIPAIYALANWRYVRNNCRIDWNPADHYLSWGAIFAIINLALMVCLGAAIGLFILIKNLD